MIDRAITHRSALYFQRLVVNRVKIPMWLRNIAVNNALRPYLGRQPGPARLAAVSALYPLNPGWPEPLLPLQLGPAPMAAGPARCGRAMRPELVGPDSDLYKELDLYTILPPAFDSYFRLAWHVTAMPILYRPRSLLSTLSSAVLNSHGPPPARASCGPPA